MQKNKEILELSEEDLEKVTGGVVNDQIIPNDTGADPSGLIPPEKIDYFCPTCLRNLGKYEKNVVFIGGTYCSTCKINVNPITIN